MSKKDKDRRTARRGSADRGFYLRLRLQHCRPSGLRRRNGVCIPIPGVVYAKENLYTCSESGIVEIQKAIRKHDLNRVVVASCSPRTHQPLFHSSWAADINPYLFEMVNIRDQCSWVHMQERYPPRQRPRTW